MQRAGEERESLEINVMRSSMASKDLTGKIQKIVHCEKTTFLWFYRKFCAMEKAYNFKKSCCIPCLKFLFY